MLIVSEEIGNQSTRNVNYLPVCCLFASKCSIITGNRTPKVVARPILTVWRTVAQKHTRQDQALSCCRRGSLDGTDITSKDECSSFVIFLYQQIQNQESDIVLLPLRSSFLILSLGLPHFFMPLSLQFLRYLCTWLSAIASRTESKVQQKRVTMEIKT